MVGGVQEESERAAKLIPKLGNGERGNRWARKALRRLSQECLQDLVSV
jgi:hypothetical protein